MLWSLLKIILFIAIVAGLAIGAGRLMEADGAIRVAFANTEFTLGPLQAAIAALLLILAVWLLLKVLGLLVAFLRFLNGDETAFSRYRSRSRERKGYRALADGMLALASGEAREAQAKAQRAEKYLRRPELTNLMIAQAAEMNGDTQKADAVYKQLLKDERTRFVGVRGLMKHQLEAGNTDTALQLAEKAFAMKPAHTEMQDTLLRLQAAKEDWSGARRTLGAKLKSGTLPRDVHKRRDAVLALGQAREIFEDGKDIEARTAAIEANRLSPDLVPAAVLAARGYIANNQERYATRVIKSAWGAQPHPDLAAAYAAIQPNESAGDRVKRFQKLIRSNTDHPEARMVMAELHIANEDFPAARRALGDLATSDPTARSVTIMAAIERGEGASDAVVRGWLAKALTVSRGPQWVCGNCNHIHADWGPTCANCGAFDTMSWKEPEDGTVALPAQTGMLPLIVGEIEDQRVQVVVEEEGSEAAPAKAVEPAEVKSSGNGKTVEAPAPAEAPKADGGGREARTSAGEGRSRGAKDDDVTDAEVIVPAEGADTRSKRPADAAAPR